MARMHSRKKGKSGSKKPTRKSKPTWIRYTDKEIELIVMRLAKEGLTPSQIGLSLRDSYGVPSIHVLANKKLSKVMEEKKILPVIPEDLMALIRKTILIKKHMEGNRHDQTAKRGLELTDSKIRRLTKYYKRNGRLAVDWKYDPEKIRLLIE